MADIQLTAADLELEAICPGTVGEGCALGRMKSGAACPTCGGRGIVVTPLGEHILSFVIRNAPAWREKHKTPCQKPKSLSGSQPKVW